MSLRLRIILTVFVLSVLTVNGQKGKHTVATSDNAFLLDGKPFQVISAEMYPARIPAEHWQHRIQQARALGCNTIIIKIFWNYHEQEEGVFDFSTWNRNIAEFCRLVQEEGLFLIVDPGPYPNEGWELGGVPAWLVRKADLKKSDPAFVSAREIYISRLTEELKTWMASNGGPVLMVQKESMPGFMNRIDSGSDVDTTRLILDIKSFIDSGKSFSLGAIHGGTNFGYTAGAEIVNNSFEPYFTSYLPDALLNEHGVPAPAYFAIRKLLESYLPKKQKLPEVPANKQVIELSALNLQPFSSFWDNLNQAVESENPATFDSHGQDQGFMLYRTELANVKNGKLIVTGLHDYAIVFLNGKYLGKLDRTENLDAIDVPATNEKPVLDLLVEAMGRPGIDEGIDRKGISGDVTLDGTKLENWKIYPLPMTEKFIYNLRSSGKNLDKPGIFFRGNFMISSAAGVGRGDTFIDVSNFTKGVVWVNGHNLGRYWNKNPQKRLYCPAGWIREGMNEIMVFDLHETSAKMIRGWKTMN